MRSNFFENEILCGYTVKGEIKKLWAVELDLLKQFIDVCEKHSLQYYAMFGTMLGAVRHGGFIPWDDDVDIAMPRADYNRLRMMPEIFDEPYFLQTPENDPEACPRYMKLRNSRTTNIPMSWPNQMIRGGHMGICIDILPLDDVPSSSAAKRLSLSASRCHELRLKRAAIDENGWERTPKWKQEYCKKAQDSTYEELTARYHEICSRHMGTSKASKYYTIAVIEGDHIGVCLEKADFAETVYLDFEHMKIAVPSGYKRLLQAIYEGDTSLPEESMREPQHEGFISPDRPYTTYTSRYTDVFDELDGKRLLLFGAGDSLRVFVQRYGRRYQPECTFDNDCMKWGMLACGVPVRSPEELSSLFGDDSTLVVVSIHHKSISEQLCNIGICDHRVFIDGWDYEKHTMRGL